MGFLPETYKCGLRMRRVYRERLLRHRGLAIPVCITARAWRTCRDACRDRQLAVSFEVGGGENVPGIPGACAAHNFTYLVRGPCPVHSNEYEHSSRFLAFGCGQAAIIFSHSFRVPLCRHLGLSWQYIITFVGGLYFYENLGWDAFS